jgi:hypothetical protein
VNAQGRFLHEGTDEIFKLKSAAAVLGKEYEAFQ